MEVDTPDGMISAEVRAETFLQWMEELKEKLGIPKYPDMIREEDVNQIVKWAQKEANPVYLLPSHRYHTNPQAYQTQKSHRHASHAEAELPSQAREALHRAR